MAVIVIAYKTYQVDGNLVRIYDDSTEKYFESADMQDTKDYIEYLSTSKGYTVDSSEVVINKQGDFNVSDLFKEDALSKLSEKEKEALGLV